MCQQCDYYSGGTSSVVRTQDDNCRRCGHAKALHNANDCVYHDSDGPCVCAGYLPPRQ